MTQFEIEWAGVVAGVRGIVLARVVGARDFRVDVGTTLGGYRLCPTLEMPRALDADGRQREDLFAFELASPGDAHHFAVGQVVSLAHAGGHRDPAP